MKTKATAIVAFLALVLIASYSQAQGRGGAPVQREAPSTQLNKGALDAKKVVEAMQDNLGMLRGAQRNDAANRLEYWGTAGTLVRGGRSLTLTNWKVSINFNMQGMRFDYTSNGQRTIEVVSD